MALPPLNKSGSLDRYVPDSLERPTTSKQIPADARSTACKEGQFTNQICKNSVEKTAEQSSYEFNGTRTQNEHVQTETRWHEC